MIFLPRRSLKCFPETGRREYRPGYLTSTTPLAPLSCPMLQALRVSKKPWTSTVVFDFFGFVLVCAKFLSCSWD